MLETFEVSKVLIIAPLRVARDTWPTEIEKWDHLQGLDISVIVGDTKTRIAALHHPAMIYVINRENIKWLVEYYEKNGMRWDFGMVVIDELSSFKNYQSQRFKFLRKVRPYVKRWVGLTGTPSSNGLMDLWAEIGILDGGERLGKFIGRYREAYFKASSMNPSTGVVFQYKPREGAEELIYQRISDMMLIGLDKSGQKSDIYHTARQERRKPKGEIQMKNKKYYIAYGSNLSVEQMAYRCPDAKIAGQAVLAGWELLFRGCATIAPNPKKNTPVLVWEISERDEGNLDLYEGYPNYYRKEDLNIELLREEAEPEMVTAMVYIMENDFGHRTPSRYYYKVLHDGYKAFHFPMHILEGALKECMDKDAAQRMIEEVQA